MQNYEKLKQQLTNDLLEVSGGQGGSQSAREVQESSFEPLPVGSRVKVKPTSFSKLRTGDYILVVVEGKAAVRRFVRIAMAEGMTRLVILDGLGTEEAVPFTKLIGLVQKVRKGGEVVEMKSPNFFQRAAFSLTYRLTRLTRRVA